MTDNLTQKESAAVAADSHLFPFEKMYRNCYA